MSASVENSTSDEGDVFFNSSELLIVGEDNMDTTPDGYDTTNNSATKDSSAKSSVDETEAAAINASEIEAAKAVAAIETTDAVEEKNNNDDAIMEEEVGKTKTTSSSHENNHDNGNFRGKKSDKGKERESEGGSDNDNEKFNEKSKNAEESDQALVQHHRTKDNDDDDDNSADDIAAKDEIGNKENERKDENERVNRIDDGDYIYVNSSDNDNVNNIERGSNNSNKNNHKEMDILTSKEKSPQRKVNAVGKHKLSNEINQVVLIKQAEAKNKEHEELQSKIAFLKSQLDNDCDGGNDNIITPFTLVEASTIVQDDVQKQYRERINLLERQLSEAASLHESKEKCMISESKDLRLLVANKSKQITLLDEQIRLLRQQHQHHIQLSDGNGDGVCDEFKNISGVAVEQLEKQIDIYKNEIALKDHVCEGLHSQVDSLTLRSGKDMQKKEQQIAELLKKNSLLEERLKKQIVASDENIVINETQVLQGKVQDLRIQLEEKSQQQPDKKKLLTVTKTKPEIKSESIADSVPVAKKTKMQSKKAEATTATATATATATTTATATAAIVNSTTPLKKRKLPSKPSKDELITAHDGGIKSISNEIKNALKMGVEGQDAPTAKKLKKSAKKEESVASSSQLGVRKKTFEERCKELAEYKKRKGDLNLLSSDKEFTSLARWVRGIRTNAKNKALPNGDKKKLDDLGFVWGPPKKKGGRPSIGALRSFDARYEQLLAHKEKHGDLSTFKDYREKGSLSRWVRQVREKHKEVLTDEERNKLDDIGFVWESKTKKYDREWKENLEKLAAYKERHSHCNVPFDYVEDEKNQNGTTENDNQNGLGSIMQLGRWVNSLRMKRHNVRSVRKQQLIDAGFDFDQPIVDPQNPTMRKRKNKSFEDRVEGLSEYKAKHGDCNIPCRYEPDKGLAEWVKNVRRGHQKITQEQRKLLSKIGFNWETKINRQEREWKQTFERLKNYKRRFGSCKVPWKYEDDRHLSEWVHTQRKLNNKNNLRPDRKEMLQSIDFIWNGSNHHSASSRNNNIVNKPNNATANSSLKRTNNNDKKSAVLAADTLAEAAAVATACSSLSATTPAGGMSTVSTTHAMDTIADIYQQHQNTTGIHSTGNANNSALTNNYEYHAGGGADHLLQHHHQQSLHNNAAIEHGILNHHGAHHAIHNAANTNILDHHHHLGAGVAQHALQQQNPHHHTDEAIAGGNPDVDKLNIVNINGNTMNSNINNNNSGLGYGNVMTKSLLGKTGGSFEAFYGFL